MLYNKREEASLNKDLFLNPTSEYRGAPFWSWNCKLEEAELLRQIDVFKEMGMGGFNSHSRAGMATHYMGEEFMSLLEACSKKAIQNDMLCYLYDEDRWPSGAAGGIVTKDYAYRMRFLLFVKANAPKQVPAGSDHKTLLARYKIRLSGGCLSEYKRLPIDKASDTENPEDIWEAYLVITADSPWFNGQSYVNTLDKKAVDRFIEVTHKKYHERLGNEFGKSIPAIFTDEPHFFRWQPFERSEAGELAIAPFTDDLEETYKQTYGTSLLDHLPEIFLELPANKPSATRYRFHDHICERFTQAFSDNIGEWCKEHGIMLTGHMMSEASLNSQTGIIGEAMRAYRAFQLPGIDILCDIREFSTAKQAQSAVRQYGREGMLSELYGVTNWDFDFRGHKLQGDWQAALGVTVRVHHLTWVSMAGEAKRDYPASIGYQSPWYKKYPYVEDHFARVNTALVRGKPIVKAAVIHPIESLWMCYGPRDKTSGIRAELEQNFDNIIRWLLFGHIDFDFVSESLLPDLYEETAENFTVGKMAYDAVIIPNCLSLRSTTLDALRKFRSAGGTVIFAGNPAGIVDGESSGAAEALAADCIQIPFSKTYVLNALENFREVSIDHENGNPADWLIYQLRQDGDDKWLFVCNGTRPEIHDIPRPEPVRVSIKGEYRPVFYDTLDGSTMPIPAEYHEGWTIIKREMHMHDSLLLKLIPGRSDEKLVHPVSVAEWTEIAAPHKFELSEPNVLVLDMATHDFSDAPEDILRIDDFYRDKMGYETRSETMQPWAIENKQAKSMIVSLRFLVASEIELDEIYIALENPDKTEIIWNSQLVSSSPVGYYTDRSIQKVKLPPLKKGTNNLELRIRFDPHTPLENVYILGKFGVRLQGQFATLVEYPSSLSFGDITRMGLPFYGGNVSYTCFINTEGGRVMLESSYFRCPLLTVKVNGKPAGIIAYAPYTLDLGELPKGRHELEITAFGNRNNTFGALHNVNERFWCGPNAWRTTGAEWTSEYKVKPAGVLKAPRVGV